MKLITTAVGIALTLTLSLTQLTGATVRWNTPSITLRTNVCGTNFADVDNDGVCDNRCNWGNGGNHCARGKNCR